MAILGSDVVNIFPGAVIFLNAGAYEKECQ